VRQDREGCSWLQMKNISRRHTIESLLAQIIESEGG
jgi:hypothetical protein